MKSLASSDLLKFKGKKLKRRDCSDYFRDSTILMLRFDKISFKLVSFQILYEHLA